MQIDKNRGLAAEFLLCYTDIHGPSLWEREQQENWVICVFSSWLNLGFYFLLYSFLGWVLEAICCAVAKRRFYNRGFLSLPLLPSYGLIFCLLLVVLPSLSGRYVLQFIATLVLVAVGESLTGYFIRLAGSRLRLGETRSRLFSGSGRGVLASLAVALGYYLIYLVVHPLGMALVSILPRLFLRIVVIALLVLVALDFAAVLIAVRAGDAAGFEQRQQKSQQGKLAQRLSDHIWRRLQKSYPGIREMDEAEQGGYTFAKGLCLDKLIWVFLIAALLGCVIEFFYCGLVDGTWMNRSSVLYGPFSFVWGFGAVVLTITLQPVAKKHDRYVFLSGFVIGGAYEYLCSVVTERLFGTVFWDYSDMPLNIGGRTNVLYCFFWGVLALVWVKLLYPPLSGLIEKLPVLTGKILTWVIVFFIVCDAALTASAMLRYHTRAARPEPSNVLEEALDRQYDDERIESRWPNMIVTGD